MSSPVGCRRFTDDRGVVVVLVAACMVALLVVASIIIDLGGERHAKARDQDIADAAALAGAASIDPSGGTNQGACLAAWKYLTSNLGTSASSPPTCTTFAGTCVAATSRTVTATQGAYRVTFTNPVLDTDTMFTGQPAVTPDGIPCHRFGVTIQHTWNNLLQRGSETLVVRSLGKYSPGVGQVAAPLVVESPHACEALTVAGNSHVTTLTSTGAPGYISIDSDGAQCTSGNKVVVDATGTAQITAGAISMWALATGNTATAFDPADVGPTRAIWPAPIPASAPVGRSAMNNVYNCTPANGCPGPGPSAIQTLVTSLGSGIPAGYTRWSTFYNCSNVTSDLVIPAGNWYVDCGSNGLGVSANLTFRGGNIVLDSAFSLSGSGNLRVNCNVASAATACPADPASPSTMFIRSGGLNKSGSISLTMHETFVYMATGGVDLEGSGTLDWTAPDDPTYPFNNLLTWVASSAPVKITGGTNTTLEGIFYAPDSAATLSGNSSTTGLGVQMFVATATMSGDLLLAPDEDRMMLLGGAGSSLIR